MTLSRLALVKREKHIYLLSLYSICILYSVHDHLESSARIERLITFFHRFGVRQRLFALTSPVSESMVSTSVDVGRSSLCSQEPTRVFKRLYFNVKRLQRQRLLLAQIPTSCLKATTFCPFGYSSSLKTCQSEGLQSRAPTRPYDSAAPNEAINHRTFPPSLPYPFDYIFFQAQLSMLVVLDHLLHQTSDTAPMR